MTAKRPHSTSRTRIKAVGGDVQVDRHRDTVRVMLPYGRMEVFGNTETGFRAAAQWAETSTRAERAARKRIAKAGARVDVNMGWGAYPVRVEAADGYVCCFGLVDGGWKLAGDYAVVHRVPRAVTQ